jgi:ubiquinone/menaquinone biosynthesis C-methylase UbiE
MTTTADFWALGDYDRIAELVADLGTDVVAAAAVGPGMRVLDVGAGTGNAALPAAAAGADVVATDVTPELLAVGERHARERGLVVRWQVADAQALPFADGEFDVVLSCIGAMFAPDHAATARELLRVCRPGGTVVMANWTPDGGVGRFFRLLGRYGPPPGEGPSPAEWGDPRHVAALFAGAFAGAEVHTEPRMVRLGFTGSPAEVAAYYRRHFPPVIATFAGLGPDRAAMLQRELTDLYAGEDTGPAGGPSCYELEYLLVRVRVPVRTPSPAG